MSGRRTIKTSKDLLQVLADLFDEIGPETPEEIDATLREAGYDPDQVGARMAAAAERAIAQSPLNWRNRARQEREAAERKLSGFDSRAPQRRNDLLAEIRRLGDLLGPRQAVAVQYRNLDDIPDGDLESLLADLQYLEAERHRQGDESH